MSQATRDGRFKFSIRMATDGKCVGKLIEACLLILKYEAEFWQEMGECVL
jgi:hypothetical protein